METIEITYTVFGFEEAGETTFEMDVSERTYERLEEAEDNGEMLDQWNPDDGMVEKVNSWGYPYKEKDESRSHDAMRFASDYDIEYTIDLF